MGRVLFNGVSPLVVCFENILVRRPVASSVRCNQGLKEVGLVPKSLKSHVYVFDPNIFANIANLKFAQIHF